LVQPMGSQGRRGGDGQVLCRQDEGWGDLRPGGRGARSCLRNLFRSFRSLCFPFLLPSWLPFLLLCGHHHPQDHPPMLSFE
jgi:hypothetical protein